MAKVQGVKEKLHFQLYDAFFVPEKDASGEPATFGGEMNKRDPRMIRFFMDIQNKTKLETNLQAAGVLPSLNTFEARAMRVVVSSLRKVRPIEELVGEAEIVAQLIYNSVITLLVGEKVMIEAPTFYFPSGAGVSPGLPTVSNHGQPDPLATFRFAEPVTIEPQQNFRVEMLFPQGVPGQATPPTKPSPKTLAGTEGPLRVWVMLDGYLTRDVQ
jgi:hypothetical protein